MTLRPRGAPDWSESHHRGPAKCRSISEDDRKREVFFEHPLEALEICNGGRDGVVCPRRTECLRAAMWNAEPYGVWGGMTAADRLRMRLRYPQAPERWTWHPYHHPAEEDAPCQKAS